jgi:threonine aldolase
MRYIDLRSDTVTQPTPEMWEAMSKAKLGDDVYGEDPTVNKLQELAASITGKEAALFVPSGTMGNLAAILAQCQRGDEVIMGANAHTFLFEAGGISALGGVHSAQIQEQANGSLALDDLEAAIRPDDEHEPITTLIEIENTHNRQGGSYQSPEYMRSVGEFAHERGIKVHVDGARIFNSAAAQKIDVKELVDPVDSVTFCLSKGLCAPVGSVLCGSKEFIRKAHRMRKQLGGGMRQAGILAAAGIVALEVMIQRLGEDHARTMALAEGLKKIDGLVVEFPQTNMVYLNLSQAIPMNAVQVADRLQAHGVIVHETGARRFRLVTHYWIDDAAVQTTIAAFREVIANL